MHAEACMLGGVCPVMHALGGLSAAAQATWPHGAITAMVLWRERVVGGVALVSSLNRGQQRRPLSKVQRAMHA